jgi:hypothetical protein
MVALRPVATIELRRAGGGPLDPALGTQQAPKIVSFDGCYCYFLMVVFDDISIAQCHSMLKVEIRQRITFADL